MTTIAETTPHSGNEESVTVTRPEDTTSTLYRYVCDIDVDVQVTVEVTDYEDTEFEYAEIVQEKTVTSNSVSSDYITEPWQRIRFTFTPQNTTTQGTVLLREIHKND